jgi:hypothetical protein
MIHTNVELHNVAELRRIDPFEGLCFQRVPEDVRSCLNEGAQGAMLHPACVEIRFVSDVPTTKITLSCPEGTTEVLVFFGLFQCPERFQIGRRPQTIEVTLPEQIRDLPPALNGPGTFAPCVRRVVLGGSPAFLHDVEGEGLRPPAPDEVPALRYLAYGTSITHGFNATGPHLCYVAQAARHLGADLINLGVGGSAFCEPELADYMAGRDDWHVASLALSVNMIHHEFSLDDFYERVSYMVNTVAGADRARPVFCITIYPYYGDHWNVLPPECKGRPEEFRQRLRDAVAACPYPNAHLVEGRDILPDISGLATDMIHPSDNGMIDMGINLARVMADDVGLDFATDVNPSGQ